MYKPGNALITLFLSLCLVATVAGQSNNARTLSGVVMTQQNEVVQGVTVLVRSSSGEERALTDAEGRFNFGVPDGPLSLKLFGRNIALVARTIGAEEASENLQVRVTYIVPPVHASVVIEATTLDPAIDQ
jgi:hypothetical protein